MSIPGILFVKKSCDKVYYTDSNQCYLPYLKNEGSNYCCFISLYMFFCCLLSQNWMCFFVAAWPTQVEVIIRQDNKPKWTQEKTGTVVVPAKPGQGETI